MQFMKAKDGVLTAKDEVRKKVRNGTRCCVSKSRHQSGQVATDKTIKDFFLFNKSHKRVIKTIQI